MSEPLVARASHDLATGLRVLFFVFAFPPEFSGATIQAIELARALERRGVRCSFLAQTEDPFRPAVEESHGFVVRRIARRGSVQRFGAKLAAAITALRDSFDLLFFVGNPGEFWTTAWATAAARACKKRVHVELNMEFYDGDPLRIRGSRLQKMKSRLAREVDVFLPNSSAILRAFPFDLVGRRATLLPYGLDLDRFRPAMPGEARELRARWKLPLDRPIVASAGAVTARKNVDFVLRAWREVVRRRPARPPLLLWLGPVELEGQGHDRAFARAVIDEASSPGLAGHVRFEGSVDDVDAYLRACDAFVFASRQEGSPSAVREAMATGLPTVMLDLGEITRELIEHSVSGLVVPVADRERFNAWQSGPYDVARDLDTFVASVVRVLDDRRLSNALGHSGRERAFERFSIDVRAERWLELAGFATSSRRQAA